MKFNFFLKGLMKINYLTKIKLISLYYNCKLKMIWSVGRNVTFEGKLYIPSFGGNVFIGSGVRFGPHVRIGASSGANITIGRNVSINQGTFIISIEDVSIGDNTRIGEYVSIRDNDHAWESPTLLIINQGFVSKKTVIGEDVWIGRGVVISKGVTIGDGAIIGANAVITKNVEPYTVNVGIPSRMIKRRDGL